MAYWKCAVSESSENDKYTKQRTLQDVDVVELQALQAFLDRVKYVLPGQTMLVNIAKFVGISDMRNLFPRCTRNSIVDLWSCSSVGRETEVLHVSLDLTDLGHDHDLVARQIQLFDGLAQYDLRKAVRVHLQRCQQYCTPKGCACCSVRNSH